MLEITVVDATIRAEDRANNVVEIETVGWDRPAPEAPLPFPMDATIAGRASRLSLTSTNVTAATLGSNGAVGDRIQFDATDRLSVSAETSGTLVWVTGTINAWIRFDGAGEIVQSTERELTVSFPHPTAVTIGFQSNVGVPTHTVTVEPTPVGVATAISHFGATSHETSPDRTSALCRGHPPRIAFGEPDVPRALRTAATDTGIELRLPAAFDALYPAASLATYLDARVRLDEDAPPAVLAPSLDLRYEFAPPPAFQHEAAALLRRTFFLDVLVRWREQTEFDWLEADVLALLDVDTARCSGLPLAERVARYLAVDFERVSPVFPAWLHNAYVESTIENARALPFLAANLTQCYAPGASPDRARAAADVDGRAATVRTGPRPRTRGPYVGWLGDDPLDGAYRASPAAYRNREAYLGDRDGISVVVVRAGSERDDAFERLLAEYRVDRPPIEVDAYEAPTRAELADRIAAGVDLLHVAGPCRDGLPCADGPLAPGDLEPHAVRTFFLDGPGALETADELIAAGSVAGAALHSSADAAIADAPVADASAIRRRFLRGIVGGFTVELAARYARELHDGPAPLAVVGDGLYELVVFGGLQVFPLEVEPVGNRRFRVRIPTLYADPGAGFGGLSLEHWQFGGNGFDLTLSADGLATLLETRWYLVVYDGELYRPDAVGPFASLV